MNPFVCEVTCDVCGEGGMATPDTDARRWDSRYSIQHNDPRVCANALARKARKLKEREAALEALEKQAAEPLPIHNPPVSTINFGED